MTAIPRGSVVRLATSGVIGFRARREPGQPVVCVTPALWAQRLPFLACVPLLDGDDGYPLGVPVSAAESGLDRDAFAICLLVKSVPVSSVLPGIAGRLEPGTVSAINRLLRLFQGL